MLHATLFFVLFVYGYGEEMNRRTAEENELVLQKRRAALETAINVSEERGEASVKDGKPKLAELDTALQKAKRYMRDYLGLFNVKMALDIEIATYKTILEGEEHSYEEEMNRRTAEENELVLQKRFEDLRTAADRNGNDLQNSKNEITELNRLIQRLKGEIESAKSQDADAAFITKVELEAKIHSLTDEINFVRALYESCAEMEAANNDAVVKNCKLKVAELEAALQKDHKETTTLKREYKEMMNVKLILDMEIDILTSLALFRAPAMAENTIDEE